LLPPLRARRRSAAPLSHRCRPSNIHTPKPLKQKQTRSDAERAAGAYEAYRPDPSDPHTRVEADDYRGADEFAYSRVFGPEATNAEVFDSLVDLDPLLSGIHTTIFAYGATGSGKTHTMLGAPGGGDEGLLPRTLYALFDEIARRPGRCVLFAF
jgi:hypothetical protein